MRSKLLFVTLLTALTLFSAAPKAHSALKDNSVGLQLGLVAPSDSLGSAFGFGLNYQVMMGEKFGMGFDFSYSTR